jgi:hypothetical protein
VLPLLLYSYDGRQLLLLKKKPGTAAAAACR